MTAFTNFLPLIPNHLHPEPHLSRSIRPYTGNVLRDCYASIQIQPTRVLAAAKSPRCGLARIVVLPGESWRRFDALLHALQDGHLPATATNSLLVGRMAVAPWRQLRARDALTIVGQARPCAFLSHYEARCHRQFSRALQCRIDLRAARAGGVDAFKNGAKKNISGEKSKI